MARAYRRLDDTDVDRYSSTAPPVLVLAPADEPSPLERAYERLLAA
ncbi:MAG TPA: hypothetical protein VIG79_00590 [Lapillicoccus sp.]